MKSISLDENSQKEEWGGWKIVSDMLDKPDEFGIYPTSECYQKLYEFVCEQKQNERERILKEIKEFSFAKTWELDKNKFYIDATPDEIIEIIKK